MKLRDLVQSEGLMAHRIAVTGVRDRRVWLEEHCADRSVLHVGCCDVPVFDPETNLHIFLSKHTPRLDGLDISEEGLAVLRRHVAGDYFTSPTQIDKQYDVVLVPEVIEHTPNAHDFLRGVFHVVARTYLITAPHIQWFERTRRDGEFFYEEVHGDHRAWYSPYTLLNTVRPFVHESEDDLEVFLIENTGSVAVRVTTRARPRRSQRIVRSRRQGPKRPSASRSRSSPRVTRWRPCASSTRPARITTSHACCT